VDDRLAETVLLWSWRVEGDGLHAGGAADGQVGQLGGKVHAVVVGQSFIGGVQQDEPDGFAVGGALVQGQAHGLLAEVDLDDAGHGQLLAGQQPAQLAQAAGRSRWIVRAAERLGGRDRRDGDGDGGRHQPPPSGTELHGVLLPPAGGRQHRSFWTA
jgi:hypothetical protein